MRRRSNELHTGMLAVESIDFADWYDAPDDGANRSVSRARRFTATHAVEDAQAELPRIRSERENKAREHFPELIAELREDPESRDGNKRHRDRLATRLLVLRYGVRSPEVRESLLLLERRNPRADDMLL